MVANGVNTIDARWTAEALANPPESTPTPVPSASATLALPSATPILPTLTPTLTLTPTATQPPVSAELLGVWTYPSSKTDYSGNEGFGIAISLKNTGSEAWLPGYQLKLVSHIGPEEVTVQSSANLAVAVPPGGKVEFDLWAFGSEHPGKHTYTFKLFSNYGIAVAGGVATFTYTAI